MGLRGLPDGEIRKRLQSEELLFMTQDQEFMSLPPRCRSVIVVSRVPQDLPIRVRAEIWIKAVDQYLARRPDGKLFEVLESGQLVPWTIVGPG